MAGRFLGAVILNWITARKFLLITVLVSVLGIAGLFTGVKMITITSFIIIGLGFANIFPLIFSITIDNMPQRANELSGLMVMAIVGGAILPPIMGKISDLTSMTFGFFVPLIAILYILFISFYVSALQRKGVRI